MMGSEDQGFVEAKLYASREEMENLFHPLSLPITKEDPLNSPSSYSSNKSPNFSDNHYLEPPSYADVIFSPFGGSCENGGFGTVESFNGGDIESPNFDSPFGMLSRSSSSLSSSGDYLKISVSNPQKEQELSNTNLIPGGNTYVTYLITTRTNLVEFGVPEVSVRRRFKDIVTLSDRLSESYRGFFIPPRPDKNVVESQVMQKQEFVEQRRFALEKYLCRLASHPVIKKSEELRVFLQCQGKLPLPTTTDVASRMLDGAVNLPKQLFGESVSVVAPHEVEFKQSVSSDWGGFKPLVAEEDKEFIEKKEKLQDLETQLTSASQQAELLVKAQHDIGETLGELGLAFIKLTKFESEEAMHNSQRIRAADIKRLATAAVQASRYYRESNAKTVKNLDPLHEYLGLMLAVRGAFSDRSSALLTVQTLLSELSAMESRAEKLQVAASKIFGGDKSRIRKLEELNETIKVTEDAKLCAVKEYERIKENNRSELERLERERQDDFLNMLKGFVMNQVGYAEKIAKVWENVADETSGYRKENNS
ncbi:hypothetical protein MKW92_050320 [Papaver armeniacum]|nr:hypothetical protein MKW92_050320 [Papaver armeniacum]